MKLLLDIVDSFKIAWNAIVANKARGALTTLGIIIGILAVTTTMTAFNGMPIMIPSVVSAPRALLATTRCNCSRTGIQPINYSGR